MFWWQWLLVFLGFFGVLFFLTLWFGFVLFLRSTVASPKIQGFVFHNDLKVSREVLKNVGSGGVVDWKLKHADPTKILFKVLPKGIGKCVERVCFADDVLEFDVKGGGRRIVLFGVRNLERKALVFRVLTV